MRSPALGPRARRQDAVAAACGALLADFSVDITSKELGGLALTVRHQACGGDLALLAGGNGDQVFWRSCCGLTALFRVRKRTIGHESQRDGDPALPLRTPAGSHQAHAWPLQGLLILGPAN
jgi:hypothetical protein